jgi:adenylosuccinate lyase
MSSHARYSSPLSERYASKAMLELWSPQRRHRTWRELWLALAEAQRELGVRDERGHAVITDEGIAQMRAHLDDIDFAMAAELERRFRHDVMAHVETFAAAAPAARPFIHLGATSAFVTDNADLVLMREGLTLLRAKIVAVLRALAEFSRKWSAEPTLAYTHLQPAQLTTVGKRATLWMQDLVLDLADLDHRLATLPLRGVKGSTGTQASFLELFRGDHERVRELERNVVRRMGFTHVLPVTGQTYTRKLDAHVLGVVAGISASAAKFASDIRLLQSYGEMEEPFESEQIGSSAMAYKRNPMRSERINSLARFVMTLEENANLTHSVQFFERTLDDSANRRLVIPEMFLAADAILLIMENIAAGLEVHPARIRQRIDTELPFMATEKLIVRMVAAGGDRQNAHAIIRRHSLEAGRALKDGALRNDLLDRLLADPEFTLSGAEMEDLVAAENFTGRSQEQVMEFLREIVDPILHAAPLPDAAEALRV